MSEKTLLFDRGPTAVRHYLDRRIEGMLDQLEALEEENKDYEGKVVRENLTIYVDALQSVRAALFGEHFDHEKAKKLRMEKKRRKLKR